MVSADFRRGALALLVFSACGGDTGSEDLPLDRYDREFSFAVPVPCRIFVKQREIDERAYRVRHVVAVADGRELEIMYTLSPEDSLPVQVRVGGGDGRTLLWVQLGAHDLESGVGDAAGVALRVSGYDGPAHETRSEGGLQDVDAAALAAFRCGLAFRPELGSIAAFLHNRPGGRVDPGGPSSHTSSPRALVPWVSRVTILGALLLTAACVEPAGWRCPCLDLVDAVAGAVQGWC